MSMNVLRVFVAKSFSEIDQPKVAVIETFLDTFKPLGVLWETGERSEAESVSAKVRERIDYAQVFVGIVTRRHPIILTRTIKDLWAFVRQKTVQWTAPPWVL